jgi:hypothetical protein
MATCFVMDMTGPPHWSQSVPDGPKLGDKIGSFIRRTWLRVLDDTVVVGTTMLPAMFVAVAAITTQVRRKLRKQGDHVARVLPSSKHNHVSFGHRTSP